MDPAPPSERVEPRRDVSARASLPRRDADGRLGLRRTAAGGTTGRAIELPRWAGIEVVIDFAPEG